MSTTKSGEIVAGTAGVFIVLLGLIGLSRVVSTPHGTPPPPPTAPPVLDDVSAIKQAVREADEAEARAQRRRSAEGLERYFTGAALSQERTRIEELVRERQRVESSLIEIAFNDVRYTPGSKMATVLATETWRTSVYDQESGERLAGPEEKEHPQQQELVLEGGRWKVSEIEHFTRATPAPTPPPQQVVVPPDAPRQDKTETDYDEADSKTRQEIQARYEQRARAFANRDLEAYFEYALPEWEWKSEGGDRSTLAESREFYRKVFEKGEARSLETRIVKAYAIREGVVLAAVVIGTARGEDEGRLIGQLDLWVRRGAEWYCLREFRLARSDSFSITALRRALED